MNYAVERNLVERFAFTVDCLRRCVWKTDLIPEKFLRISQFNGSRGCKNRAPGHEQDYFSLKSWCGGHELMAGFMHQQIALHFVGLRETPTGICTSLLPIKDMWAYLTLGSLLLTLPWMDIDLAHFTLKTLSAMTCEMRLGISWNWIEASYLGESLCTHRMELSFCMCIPGKCADHHTNWIWNSFRNFPWATAYPRPLCDRTANNSNCKLVISGHRLSLQIPSKPFLQPETWLNGFCFLSPARRLSEFEVKYWLLN